ncbi:MAG TPA: DUF3127 domain-containing protein [Tenuifilaceae bacterium]|nr:DUF3127 domain-containing protein [Tenuifilaceae bacterium]HPQ35473.1 DUF3127 domain-containing protein [Tenuifilaceae bacterium]
MEITGKLQSKLPQQSGQGKNGAWVKQEFILETQEQYPRKVCISLWGDKVRDLEPIQPGETLKVSINIESREFNGRWYTDVRAWKLERTGTSSQAQVPDAPPMPSNDELPPFLDEENSGNDMNDLPF